MPFTITEITCNDTIRPIEFDVCPFCNSALCTQESSSIAKFTNTRIYKLFSVFFACTLDREKKNFFQVAHSNSGQTLYFPIEERPPNFSSIGSSVLCIDLKTQIFENSKTMLIHLGHKNYVECFVCTVFGSE